uniref:Uncharacterized protein n=1 Tax=Glossina pallidipes TaxID=7398 RepID=A0A1B0AJ52_GLOPL
MDVYGAKKKYIALLIPLILQMMTDMDHDEEWAASDVISDDDTSDNNVFAESSLDLLPCGFGEWHSKDFKAALCGLRIQWSHYLRDLRRIHCQLCSVFNINAATRCEMNAYNISWTCYYDCELTTLVGIVVVIIVNTCMIFIIFHDMVMNHSLPKNVPLNVPMHSAERKT